MEWRKILIDRRELEMKCPKCGKYALKQREESVACGFCGHQLSPGQEANFRLFKLLREEEGKRLEKPRPRQRL